MSNATLTMIAAAGIACVTAPAFAQGVQTFRDTLSVPFTIGTGNGNENFSINRFEETGGNVVEVGIKAKERWFGDGNVGGSDELYIVQDGFSPTSGAGGAPLSSDAWWNFDTSINLGSRVSDSVRVEITINNLAADPPPGVLSISTTTEATVGALPSGMSVLQGSQNLGFSPFDVLTAWNPADQGDYLFTLSVFDKTTNDAIGSTNMTVRVVPSPASASLIGLAGLAAARRRRR